MSSADDLGDGRTATRFPLRVHGTGAGVQRHVVPERGGVDERLRPGFEHLDSHNHYYRA